MADLSLQWTGDLSIGPTGDLLLADGPGLTQQRVLRRLLTNPGDYIWNLSYGAGLGMFVGQPGAPAAINGVARAQLLLEQTVATTPAPVVKTSVGSGNTVTMALNYADAASGTPSLLNFSL